MYLFESVILLSLGKLSNVESMINDVLSPYLQYYLVFFIHKIDLAVPVITLLITTSHLFIHAFLKFEPFLSFQECVSRNFFF